MRRLLTALLLCLGMLGVAAAGLAQDVTDVVFDAPQASGEFGEALTFEVTFSAPEAPRRVELLMDLIDGSGQSVDEAMVEPLGDERWRASVIVNGHVVPNTPLEFRFRAVTSAGSSESARASHRVVDTRFDWQRLQGEHVTVWWYRGDEGFARRALEIAERGLTSAADLLGVTEIEPVDFFVYADNDAFREALGPGTRENVGGEAHPAIRTLFGLVEPTQVGSDWVDEVVVHELTHLVFDAAASSVYGYPPSWLNEGLAVFLSRGIDDTDRLQVASAVQTGTLIPLEGLAGRFPTRVVPFSLAYAESVSAVDFFVERYGQDRLVEIVTAFADGVTLDEAFHAATGDGFTAFEDAWLAELGAERPQPLGPQPVEPGPVPEAWASPAAALLP